MSRPRGLLTIAIVIGALAIVGGGVAYAAFGKTTSNLLNVITARPDWLAPTASSYTIAKNSGYSSGYVKQGGTYYAYAQVAEPASNPASGIASVTADASALTSGQTAAALATTGGPWTYGGVSYNYRSALLTAGNPLAAGAKTWSLTSTDAATPSTNTATLSSLAVNVDNTAPAASAVAGANKAGNVQSKLEIGDTLTLTYNDTIDPASILSTWTGASQDVTVRLVNNAGGDLITVWDTANTAQLPLGSINAGRNDYTTGTVVFGPSTGATKSTMVQSGSTITITLGTVTSGTTTTAGNTGNMVWTPSATAYDRAANSASTATYTETDADRDF
jgi:hypothetical protein